MGLFSWLAGLFSWLGDLLEQLIAWFGRAFAAFLEALVWAIQAVWDKITPVLVAAFGYAKTLYAIFYAEAENLYETLMEVWDPRYEKKPSEVFSVEAAPANTPLPRTRSQVTKVMALKNVEY